MVLERHSYISRSQSCSVSNCRNNCVLFKREDLYDFFYFMRLIFAWENNRPEHVNILSRYICQSHHSYPWLFCCYITVYCTNYAVNYSDVYESSTVICTFTPLRCWLHCIYKMHEVNAQWGGFLYLLVSYSKLLIGYQWNSMLSVDTRRWPNLILGCIG